MRTANDLCSDYQSPRCQFRSIIFTASFHKSVICGGHRSAILAARGRLNPEFWQLAVNGVRMDGVEEKSDFFYCYIAEMYVLYI
jgi:hypothetical protein